MIQRTEGRPEGGTAASAPTPDVPSQASGDNFFTTPPALSLPKGGGAIRSIGEKFSANPVTGSSTISIPLPASPGRGGFGPRLALSYDSGSGNGPFGFGWSLALPSITRKTDKGLPQYFDAQDSDVFMLSGAEDLVPVFRQKANKDWDLNQDGSYQIDEVTRDGYRVRRYRPRTEGLFARIERWTAAGGDTHWRSISPDNVLSVYGKDASSRIFDPSDRSRIFSWLVCETRDDKGNAIVYDYRPEDATDLDLTQAHEQQRGLADAPSRTANRYIHRIRYGNVPSLLDQELRRPLLLAIDSIRSIRWMFELEFDYGKPDPDHPGIVGPWAYRSDPFSTYRAGFEVRTCRLCRRVLMFHDFPAFADASGDPAIGPRRLVRSLDLSYRTGPQSAGSSDPGYSFLQSATQWSYQRDGEVWHRRPLPPVEFTYSEAKIDDRVRELDEQSLEHLPVGLGSGYQWVDLDGEGLSGILTEQAGAWYYLHNLGDRPSGPRFGPMQLVAARPSIAALQSGRQQLIDVQGNGALDLVDFHPPLAGFQERTAEQGWKPFIPFATLPNIDWDDHNLRFVDLTGDGHADALITEHEIFTWYPSRAESGFGPAERVAIPSDERHGPRIVFADGEQSIYLSDMSGDGLSDIVRVRNAEVCYWPNLGYGRFGTQVVMDGSPCFDHPDQFEPQRIRLADIDGSGTTDLFYLGRDGARLWFNRSGNDWSEARRLPFPIATRNVGQIQVADLLGNGTACLVWSSDLPGDARRPLRYLDLMGGRKPHLLVEMQNNLGAVTTVDYAASTRFYLGDQAAGTPWATTLPFPVHCVERVTLTDRRRRTVFTNTYSYHHGYFDGVEREFRGFGRVEQVDTQRFDDVSATNAGSPFVAADHKLYQPPVKTITWFHTGIAADRSRIIGLYEREYFPSRYSARLKAAGFVEHELPQPRIEAATPGLLADEWREAMRACKGMVLRQEVIELDVKALQDGHEDRPVRIYSAVQHNCHIRRVQPRGANRHAVFLATESEAVSYHYELTLDGTRPLMPDPRVAHTLNLRFDGFGRALQSVAVVYHRGQEYVDSLDHPAPLTKEQVALIRAVQHESHLAYTDTCFNDDLSEDDVVDNYRLPAPCEVRTYELTGVDLAGKHYYSVEGLRDYQLNPVLDLQATKTVGVLAYQQQPPDKTPHERLVEHAVTLYFKDDLSGPLEPGQPSRLGITYEAYKLALTTSLIDDVFKSAAGQDDFAIEARSALEKAGERPGFFAGGYQTDAAIFRPAVTPPAAAAWWVRSGIAEFQPDSARHFYLPERFIDPFGSVTTLTYDADDLLVTSSADALGNTTTVEAFDYRVLLPSRLRDLNDNVTEAAFDVRGLPVAIAAMGKVSAGVSETGDTVQELGFEERNPDHGAVATFFAGQSLDEERARGWLGKATARFLYHFGESIDAAGQFIWGNTAAGACGISREKHERDAANDPPGLGLEGIPIQVAFEYSDGAGSVFVTKVQAEPDPAPVSGPLRWIANGRTVVNNKNKPVLQYRPYFSSTGHQFQEPAAEGVATAMIYDGPGRLVRTEFPDGTLTRVEFSPWVSRSFDRNDTVLEPGNRWYAGHAAPAAPFEDRRAARIAAMHAGFRPEAPDETPRATPAEVHFDSLGREVIAVAHNRTPVADPSPTSKPLLDRPWLNQRVLTFTKLDAEGKPLWICDARGNLVMQYIFQPGPSHTALYDQPASSYKRAYDLPPSAIPGYDIAGNLLFRHGMDGGDRRMLLNAAGQPMLAWDYNERLHPTTPQLFKEHRRFETRYDPLHRPAERRLRVRDEASAAEDEFLIERSRYGEGQPGDKAGNRRGQLWQHYDGSGLVQTDAFDLCGKPLATRRRLASELESPVIDWSGREVDDIPVVPATGLDDEEFTQRTEYDALGRMIRQYNWHVESPPGSGYSDRVAVYLPAYGRRGLLASETLIVRAKKTPDGHEEAGDETQTQEAIEAITYNAVGQKLRVELGNGTTTHYTYDEETFRLVRLYTRRDFRFREDCGDTPPPPRTVAPDTDTPPRSCGVQNLHYTYDPVGNITHVQDDAQQTIWFANRQVEPSNDYLYDALYRLIEATGRENAAAMAAPPQPEGPWPARQLPSDDATRPYTQRYRYDGVGNIEEMRHLTPTLTSGEPPGWTLNYRYAEASNRLLETWNGRTADPRLGSTRVEYGYDPHGSMLNLNASPDRFDLRWDWNDMIQTIDLGGGGRAWYQYGAGKQRCRKRIQSKPGAAQAFREERIYLGGYELYRRYTSDPHTPVEEIESHHLFEGDQRVLLVDDVLKAGNPRPDGSSVKQQTLWRYQYGNHLGSVGLELDDEALVISYEEFHPYGTSAYRLMNSQLQIPAKRYRYTGMERDEESGCEYHHARYYAGTIGRWLSVDPLPPPSELNGFRYCGSNPIVFLDRSGRQATTPLDGGPEEFDLSTAFPDYVKSHKLVDGIEFRAAMVPPRKITADQMRSIAKDIKSVEALLPEPKAKTAHDSNTKIRDVLIGPETNRMRSWKGRPTVVLNEQGIAGTPAQLRSSVVHESAHQLLLNIRALAQNGDKNAIAFLLTVKESYQSLKETAKDRGIPVGLRMFDPTEWTRGLTAEHPWDNPDELFASALEAAITDVEGLRQAMERAELVDKDSAGAGNRLTSLVRHLVERNALPTAVGSKTDSESKAAAVNLVDVVELEETNVTTMKALRDLPSLRKPEKVGKPR